MRDDAGCRNKSETRMGLGFCGVLVDCSSLLRQKFTQRTDATALRGQVPFSKVGRMTNVIRTIDSQNLTIGSVGFGRRGDQVGTVDQQVHDGDTIVSHAPGNFGIRFLGIDTAEISFRFPGTTNFLSLTDARWNRFLADPFAAEWPAWEGPLEDGFVQSIRARLQPDLGTNHNHHAARATEFLRLEVRNDLQALGQTEQDFRFFLAFAHEILDGYGRFLAFVNREQPSRDQPSPRPLTYNERMLRSGMAHPYFIWPNINPFRKATSVTAAVVPVGEALRLAQSDQTLRQARQWVQSARERHLGIFDAMQPLVLEPFELRMLAGRRSPQRWVIDLSRNDRTLLKPTSYHSIPRAEDRLFIPAEYVPLFVSKGWQQET